MFPNTNKLLVF